MGVNVIDRRLNPSGKSLPNRQRFIRLAKAAIVDVDAHGGQPALSTRMYHSTSRRVWRAV